jgi:glycosyltransferase involved in cell wall biosynthesis
MRHELLKYMIFVNGRFLSNQQSAVNDVARELTATLYRRLVLTGRDHTFRLVIPADLEDLARHTDLPYQVLRPMTGVPWEQLVLPSLRRQGVILNLFNTVPLWGSGYVTLLHDAHVFRTPHSYGLLKRWWRQLLSRRAGHENNSVLTVSAASARHLQEHGVLRTRRFGIIPNAVGHVARVTPDPSILGRLGLEAQTPWCLAQASTLPHKNLALLFEAFRDPRLSEMPLVLFGTSKAVDFHAVGLAPPRTARFAGYVTHAELAALYRHALAICIPSTEEGFGLPALEGMALGAIPVVANCGALPEVVGDAGVVLPHDDAQAWVSALVGLATDWALRHRLVERGTDRVKVYSWADSAQSLLTHLDEWHIHASEQLPSRTALAIALLLSAEHFQRFTT